MSSLTEKVYDGISHFFAIKTDNSRLWFPRLLYKIANLLFKIRIRSNGFKDFFYSKVRTKKCGVVSQIPVQMPVHHSKHELDFIRPVRTILEHQHGHQRSRAILTLRPSCFPEPWISYLPRIKVRNVVSWNSSNSPYCNHTPLAPSLYCVTSQHSFVLAWFNIKNRTLILKYVVSVYCMCSFFYIVDSTITAKFLYPRPNGSNQISSRNPKDDIYLGWAQGELGLPIFWSQTRKQQGN